MPGRNSGDMHPDCVSAFFGTETVPVVDLSPAALKDFALQLIQAQTTVTGVQPKLSLDWVKDSDNVYSFPMLTVTGMTGHYILKPATVDYPELPELEDLTLHLAGAMSIATVPHCLIRTTDGSRAYLTKRIDRQGRSKLAMEDMCQLSERTTDEKYLGSHEQIGIIIRRHSASPGLDLYAFARLVTFCYLTGNSDMHLKNFSLITQADATRLSAAYDLVPTKLLIPQDEEELALTLNGRKRKLGRQDFETFYSTIGLNAVQRKRIFQSFEPILALSVPWIEAGFIGEQTKHEYIGLIARRTGRLFA